MDVKWDMVHIHMAGMKKENILKLNLAMTPASAIKKNSD